MQTKRNRMARWSVKQIEEGTSGEEVRARHQVKIREKIESRSGSD